MNGAKDSANRTTSKWTREICPKCKGRFMFYCGQCYITLGNPKNLDVPSIELPLKVDIYFNDGFRKSTAPQAKILAPNQVDLYPSIDCMPNYNYATSLLVYPSEDAVPMSEIDNLADIRTLIFIDCPWQKAGFIAKNPKLISLRRIKLVTTPKRSIFWRYHSAGEGCVATIEAIYYSFKELQQNVPYIADNQPTDKNKNEIDHLLYFFHLLHDYILESYAKSPYRDQKGPPMNEEEKERQRRLRRQKRQKQQLVNTENTKRLL